MGQLSVCPGNMMDKLRLFSWNNLPRHGQIYIVLSGIIGFSAQPYPHRLFTGLTTIMLIQNQALQSLRAYFAKYQTMLQAMTGDQGFHASPQESYAAKVFAAVEELDRDLITLRLAAGFIRDLTEPLPDIYRYHDEAFTARLAAMIGRTYALAGLSHLLKADKYLAAGGSLFVCRALKDGHPELVASLERLTALEARYLKERRARLALSPLEEGGSHAAEMDELADRAANSLAKVLEQLSAVYQLV